MNRPSFLSDGDEDQDSLFGSPPPSPARAAVPSTGVGRENVGTIALPGSHMSCAELPANLPASSLSLSRPASSHDLSSVAPPSITGKSTPLDKSSRSSSHSVISSANSTIPSPSAPARKRRTPKSKSMTPIPPAPPIALPAPDEPTPTNFLRSQSSLLGLAGLVGSVKPAQLHARSPQPTPAQHSPPHHGLTPIHPIVLDDDQDSPHIGQHTSGQLEMSPRLDELDPGALRSNIMNSLTKEKNIFPVLQSMIKLFGGEPLPPIAKPRSEAFARPYGHGILNAQSSSVLSTSCNSITSAAPPLKRRKLKHVPAGAIDWDVPFPFATGEGPQAYRDTWAGDRAKQLVTQLLELIQNATKRAAVKTAKSAGKTSKGRSTARTSQLSKSASAETQVKRMSRTLANIDSSSCTNQNSGAVTGMPLDSLDRFLGSIGLLEPSSQDGMSGGAVGEGGPELTCDYAGFEEWLSQLQQAVPSEMPTPESSDSACSSSHAIRDEAIDPTLLAMSQQVGSTFQSSASPSPLNVDIPQTVDTPPALAHSPRTSLSSPTEPCTPFSEAFTDPPISRVAAPSDLVGDHPSPQPAEKDQPVNQVQTLALPSESPRITALQKGKARAGSDVAFATPSSASRRSTPGAVPTSRGGLDKRAILERAQERRRQLVAEIERAKMEMWETTIESAVLVRYMRDEEPSS